MTMPRPVAIAVWTVPTVVLVLLIAGAWVGGVLLSDLLIPNLAWVIATSGSVGALLVTRRPGNAVGWLLWLIGIGIGIAMISTFYLGPAGATDDPVTVPGALMVAWFATWSISAVLILALLFVPLLFPTGRPPTPAWRPVAIAFVLVGGATILREMIRPGPMIDGSPVLNPFGVPDGPLQQVLGTFVDLTIPVAALVALLAVVERYRHGDAIERQQLRWFTASMSLAVVGFAVIITVPDEYGTMGFGLLVFSLGLIPLAIGIAILRYRLYEIDRIVSRTIAWLMLTVILGVVFAGLIVGLQALLAPFTERSTLAVAGSTLVAFALFQPLRRRVQLAVDQRFNRARVDAERARDAFGSRLREDVDLDAVRGRLVETARDTLKPAGVGVWLRTDAGRR